MSMPPTQLPQQFQSHRGAGTDTGGRRTGRRTAEAAGLNVNSGMQVEGSGAPVPSPQTLALKASHLP